MIPKIKVCGITKPEEIQALNDMAVDYVGFVFATSKRKITVEKAIKLRKLLNKDIKTVAVLKDPTDDLVQWVIDGQFDIIQWHGIIPEKWLARIDQNIWQGVSICNEASLNEMIGHHNIVGYVLDGKNPGSGKPFDWELLKQLSTQSNIILAGGLNAENVDTAIKTAHPHIVDVSSGVEDANGKSYEKIKTFVRKVRNYDK
ncbi:phosphoribosylanthranilate isomerase [Natranaerovirga hydrolytica]|uniref:N-(5'-phosphoribosyl)anthranilate isomerase n=1 Tax=Natranaerovirga hydrolytica TaxID=680378 RepID=A0A4R1N6G7_9FIRM|nr:phosphoribosylanthranilate isomerase [Natranaerovirga hydrolytica]TCK98223.1 phosphoribosylanthranilate isomerase [Natranaerovirga hydrolytica]